MALPTGCVVTLVLIVVAISLLVPLVAMGILCYLLWALAVGVHRGRSIMADMNTKLLAELRRTLDAALAINTSSLERMSMELAQQKLALQLQDARERYLNHKPARRVDPGPGRQPEPEGDIVVDRFSDQVQTGAGAVGESDTIAG